MLRLLYINRFTLFKLCRNKPSRQLNTPSPSLSTASTDSHPIPNKPVNSPPAVEQPTTLSLVLASFMLHDVSSSQEKPGAIIPTTVSSQHDHTPCSALIDTGSPVTLISEKIQRQLNLLATPLESHYKLIGVAAETLTTLEIVQVDILLDRKVWTTPAIVVSSLTHSLILGLNFLKLTKSKVDFETNIVEARSTLYPANAHFMQRSNSTIIIPKSEVYWHCQRLLKKKACWMLVLMLAIVIILTTVASHTHFHFNSLFKKQDKSFVSPERNLTWKELLTYGNAVRLKIRLQAARPEKTGQLYFLDCTLPPVLAKRQHISNHLVLGVYELLSPKTTSLIQRVTHAWCHLAMNASECPRPLKNPNTFPWALPNSQYCQTSFLYLPLLATCIMAVFAHTPISFVVFFVFFFTCIYIHFM